MWPQHTELEASFSIGHAGSACPLGPFSLNSVLEQAAWVSRGLRRCTDTHTPGFLGCSRDLQAWDSRIGPGGRLATYICLQENLREKEQINQLKAS